ncbi:hypothetical protein ACFQ60_47280 [Streptomyces zhihengii]
MLTDAVGPAWYGPSLPAFLACQTSKRPAAVLHVLPRRLWHRTAVPTENVDARITDPARPVLQFRTRHLPPPLQTSPEQAMRRRRALGGCLSWKFTAHGLPWAEHLGGRSSSWVPMLATPSAMCPDLAEEESGASTPQERVARFHAGSTSMAFRLACYLAAVPLSLPVMRIVQRELVPRSEQTDLAQLFVSGLIERREQQQSGQDPDDVVYDFRPGVGRNSLRS